MALTLDIAANTRAAQSQVKDLGKSLEGVSDSLDDVARDADKAGDKLDRTFKDMVSDAKKADKAVESIGDSGSKGFGKAGDAAGEFKQEALSNFSEVTSSFDGSMSSIQDLAQGTLGGLASTGLPGIGLAAGAAAVAVGAIGAAFQATDEAAQISLEKANEWADKYIEAKGRVLAEEQIMAGVQAIVTGEAEAYAEALKIQSASGTDMGVVLRALAGDYNALQTVNADLETATTESNAAMAAQEVQSTSAAGAVIDHANAIEESKDALAAQAGEMDSGAQKARAFGDAAAYGARQTKDLADGVNNLPSSKSIDVKVNADTSRIDNALNALQRRANQGITVQLNTRQGNVWF